MDNDIPEHFKVSDSNPILCKNDSSHNHSNQEQSKRHLSKDETIDDHSNQGKRLLSKDETIDDHSNQGKRHLSKDETIDDHSNQGKRLLSKDETIDDHSNQEQRKRHLSKDETIDDLQQTCIKIDDTFLLNSIESASNGQAFELLKKNHTFSQDGLDRGLILACRHGHTSLIPRLLTIGANIHFKDTKGNTPLMICAENGFVDIVRLLLSINAEVDVANSAGDTALILSMRSSVSAEMVKVLVGNTGTHINHENQDGYTALMKAVEIKDIDTISILLEEIYNQSISKWQDGHCLQQISHDHSVNYTLQKATIIAEKCGLGNVFRLLSESRHTYKSPLELAIEESDTESFNILLNRQFLNIYDKKISLHKAFRKLFHQHKMKYVKTFNDNEITMIERLLECGISYKYTIGCNLLKIAVEAESYRLVELFCKHSAQINEALSIVEEGLLETVATIGRCDIIELLLSYKAINQNSFSSSALNCALNHGHIDCAKLLIQLGATLDIKHALISAVEHQMPEFMNFLFDNYKQEVLNHLEKPENVSNLLISAVKGGNLEIISHILDTGADINRPINAGVTPLVESKNGEVAQFLIQRGADVSQLIDNKQFGRITPVIYVLMTRCDYGYCAYDSPTADFVKVLLENGASINGKDEINRTALMIAAGAKESVDMLQILLDHGADPCDKDDLGYTALFMALINRSSRNASFLLKFTKNKDILNAQNHEGLTALMYAVTWERPCLVTELINLGVDVNVTDAKGSTALMHLLMDPILWDKENITKLISAGSDVNYQNNEGFSPLMLTANRSMKDAMQILLDSGADVNAVSKTNHTRTALTCLSDYVSFRGFFSADTKCCMEYLLERGASASYVSPLVLVTIILNDYTELIPKMIHCGFGPADIKLNDIPRMVVEPDWDFKLSPQCMALLAGNVGLARYFMGILFLTHSDVSSLPCNMNLRHILELQNHQLCLNFIDETSSQPLSLFKLSFVAVSSAVGAIPGRENRVNLLPLPKMMKDKLLFKKEKFSLTIPIK